MTAIDLVHLPYKGQAPSTTDLLAGHIATMFMNPLNGLPVLRDGLLRAARGHTAPRARRRRPNPVGRRSGVTVFDVAIWFGVTAPRRTRAHHLQICRRSSRPASRPCRTSLTLSAELAADPVIEGRPASLARVDFRHRALGRVSSGGPRHRGVKAARDPQSVGSGGRVIFRVR